MLLLLGLSEILLIVSSSILHQEKSNRSSSTEISQNSEEASLLQDFDDHYYFPLPSVQQQQSLPPTTTGSQAELTYEPQINMTFNDSLLEPFIMSRTIPAALARPTEEPTIMERSLRTSGNKFSFVQANDDDHLTFSSNSGRDGSTGGIGGSKNSVVFGSSEIKPNRPNRNSDNFNNQYTNNNMGKKGTCKNEQVFFQSNCHELLRQGPCSPNQWLVEINGKGTCKNTTCPYPKIPFNGRCLDNDTLRYEQFQNCSTGMTVMIARDGTVGCDCLPEYIFNENDGNCYEAYRQGPCRHGQYFALQPGTEPPKCTRNPCRLKDYVCYGQPTCPEITKQSDCVRFGSSCDNGIGIIMVHPVTLEVTCVNLTELSPNRKTIANVPLFACAKGSKRDVNGICRKSTSFTFS